MSNKKDKPVLMYGDRVRFHWVDEDYVNNIELEVNDEYDLEGLYGGPYVHPQYKDAGLATVTVTTQGQFYGKVLHPYESDLVRIEHPALYSKKTDKTDITDPNRKSSESRGYDYITLMEMRDNIMDNFDFSAVHVAMEALNWTWASTDPDEDGQVPDESRIRREARRLLNQIIDSVGTDDEMPGLETGGFGAYFTEEDGIPNLQLRFMVSDWDEGYDTWSEYEKSYQKRKYSGESTQIPLKKKRNENH